MLSEVTNTNVYSDDKYGFTIAYTRKYLPTDKGGMLESTHHVTLKIDDDIELTLPEFTALFKLMNEAYKQADEYNKWKRELS